ncbi:GDSL-like Lipase/Acylhydrolase family protein [Asticcacaulis biprosthecium C19]|uniref:GDSL-like Lipase/Acylhydrolase family protein n=1 Tax=Asticcacaulis biprosthecium C19 TaxID=715226 RepID=F4QME6_9CAUL|nr:GDSL-type esterase/lipase family protein [Asticcacaulis biprosthecium]EGF91387.1 GDSL-like Lipase/Acylhydrolase family protein [Asticcacaulis biprosthecium C19]
MPSPGEVRIVFVGDSITEWWQDTPYWAEFSDYSLNLGVAGDRTEDVLWRLRTQLNDPDIQPAVITVMIGTNHLWDESGDIVAGQMAVIARLRELRPEAEILVFSVLPTGDAALNQAMVEPINQRLAAAVEGILNTQFVDLYTHFVDSGGRGPRHLFPDGVHLSHDGYRLWRDLLLAKLATYKA